MGCHVDFLGGVSFARLSMDHAVESDRCPVWLEAGHTFAMDLLGWFLELRLAVFVLTQQISLLGE